MCPIQPVGASWFMVVKITSSLTSIFSELAEILLKVAPKKKINIFCWCHKLYIGSWYNTFLRLSIDNFISISRHASPPTTLLSGPMGINEVDCYLQYISNSIYTFILLSWKRLAWKIVSFIFNLLRTRWLNESGSWIT